ncbi:MAG TPA: hypothetical protein VIC85_01710 [Ktedonobacterales bacterium]|jgi:hypothetical protein
MTATAIFELLACVLALVAAIFIFDQYRERPRPYKLLWTLGLVFYGIASGAVVAAELGHWNVGELKAWYFFGGVLTAAYLGLGSLYLLAPGRVARWAVAVAAVFTVYAGPRMLFLPIAAAESARLATLSTAAVTGTEFRALIPADVVVITILMNTAGALFLIGGAVWSAWTFYQKHAPGYRLTSMVLLALGGFFPTILTGLQRFGYSGGAALGEFLGAACILTGLLVSYDVFTVFRVPFTHVVLLDRQRPVGTATPRG